MHVHNITVVPQPFTSSPVHRRRRALTPHPETAGIFIPRRVTSTVFAVNKSRLGHRYRRLRRCLCTFINNRCTAVVYFIFWFFSAPVHHNICTSLRNPTFTDIHRQRHFPIVRRIRAFLDYHD